VPLIGTLGQRYFAEHRQLNIDDLDIDHVLRWHAGISAIVGLMTDPLTNEAVGVHRTLITKDGTKLEHKMLGRQGVIRLSPDDLVTQGLGIVEGVEDGLAVLLSDWRPVWAATSAGAIAKFPILIGIDSLTIFADEGRAGMGAAGTCAARWRDAGAEVFIVQPEGGAHD
jgi:hypothetical protein